MKSLNTPSRFAEIKYPKDTPRISRKRVWMDRSEWRKSPEMTAEGSAKMIDRQLENARNVGSLEQQNYLDLADLTDRAGRIGINKT
jgi:hypothetical protein